MRILASWPKHPVVGSEPGAEKMSTLRCYGKQLELANIPMTSPIRWQLSTCRRWGISRSSFVLQQSVWNTIIGGVAPHLD